MYKAVVEVLAAGFTGLFTFTILAARALRTESGQDRVAAVSVHKLCANAALGTLLLTVVAVEGMLRSGPGFKPDSMFKIHLPFAVAFLAMLIVQHVANGKKAKWQRSHRIIGYTSIVIMMAMLATGFWLIRRF